MTVTVTVVTVAGRLCLVSPAEERKVAAAPSPAPSCARAKASALPTCQLPPLSGWQPAGLFCLSAGVLV